MAIFAEQFIAQATTRTHRVAVKQSEKLTMTITVNKRVYEVIEVTTTSATVLPGFFARGIAAVYLLQRGTRRFSVYQDARGRFGKVFDDSRTLTRI